ncbi:MAG: phosphatidylserine decarboxylase [Puniceicoccales bacterium]|nr:phosphatidylserine decarboxylase [Puniceicoccales bacterium]
MNEEIFVYNRYGKAIERESICGDWLMRFAYGNRFGRLLQASIGSRIIFSRLASAVANRKFSAKYITPFAKRHGIAVEDCAEPIGNYGTFQDFFTRKLRFGARPLAASREAICAPVDGRYLHIGPLPQAGAIPVKGRRLLLGQLLGSETLAEKFTGGSAIVARLAPFDYHRIHFPCDCLPGQCMRLGRKLHGVHPQALRRVGALCANRRFLTRAAADCGEIAIVEVGATFVGSVRQTYVPGVYAKKGAEKGFFALGGSTVILLFERGTLAVDDDISHWSSRSIETYVKMGDTIGGRQSP